VTPPIIVSVLVRDYYASRLGTKDVGVFSDDSESKPSPLSDNYRNIAISLIDHFNFDPPVTEEKVRVTSRRFVRKITGINNPSAMQNLAS